MVYKEYRMTAASPTGWKLPFNLAVLLHLLLLSSALLLPKYLQKNPIILESYTVDLISIAEPVAAPPSPPAAAAPEPPQPAVKIQKLKEVSAKKTVPIAPPIAETVQAEPVKAISIKPLKRKIINKNAPDLHVQQAIKKRELEQKQKQRALEARQQTLLAEARRQRAVADAEAKVAASEAVNALKQMLMADDVASSTRTGQQSSRPSKNTSSALADQYHATIFAHLHRYWALPDIKPWDPDLTAIVVVVISQNGQIITHSFEKKSGDRVFDQFVSKTIQDANPLPPIPGALKKQQHTLGLRFKPGGIH